DAPHQPHGTSNMNAEHCNQVVAVDDAGRFPDATAVAQRYREVRAHTLERIAGLSAEDLAVQAMPDASPGKWHLAHTSWFFEAMVLQPHCGLPPLQPGWDYLFNSYYEALGARHPRPRRGLLTRPNLQQVLEYRAAVDQRM